MRRHASHPTTDAGSLLEIIRRRAVEEPGRQAFTFLENGKSGGDHLTYAEIDQRSRAIAASLQRSGANGPRSGPDLDSALILCPPGLDFVTAFLGCLYAGVVALPVHPPRRNRPDSRLDAIALDARPKFAIATSQIMSQVRLSKVRFQSLEELEWIAADDVCLDLAEEWTEPSLTGESLAYLQYTSGSTSAPRGVMVSHSNLIHNLECLRSVVEFDTASVVLTWLPPMHDLGLVSGILEPLYAGCSAYLMSPGTFLQQPIEWLEAISRYKVTHSGAPNFAYDLCVDKTSAEQRKNLDLSSWTVAFNGAEPVRKETLHRFNETFGPHGFRWTSWYPCYGLAESVLMVSGGRVADPPAIKWADFPDSSDRQLAKSPFDGLPAAGLVGSGQAALDTQIKVVHPESSTQCAPGEVGELWVSGPSVAQGYWNRNGDSAETFRATLADTGEGPFLRTGDLGFIEGQELFVTGRLKDLIVIRGLNHYPQDIELTLQNCHTALRTGRGAAFTVANDGPERLVVVQEVGREKLRDLDAGEVARAAIRAVAEEHGIQVHSLVLVKPASIPKTPSGKVQRYLCRTRFLSGSLAVIAEVRGQDLADHNYSDYDPIRPATSREHVLQIKTEDRRQWLEEYFIEQIARVLEIAPGELDSRISLSNLGLDSLMTAEFQNLVAVDLGVTLSFQQLLADSSIRRLADEAWDQITRSGLKNESTAGVFGVGNSAPSFNDKASDYSNLDYQKWSLMQTIVRKSCRVLIRLVAGIEVDGLENIPPSGPVVLAFNHLHFSDGLLFFLFVPRRLVFLVSEGWQKRPLFKWLFTHLGNVIFIERGKGDLAAIKEGLAVLRAGGVLCIAPEGGISEDGRLGHGQSGVVHLANQAPAPVFPMVAYGQEQTMSVWKRLRRVPIHVRIGKTVESPMAPNGLNVVQGHTNAVMQALAEMLPPEYRGVYESEAQAPEQQATDHIQS